MFQNPDVDARCALLKKVKTIAVVGLSPNPARPSYGVSAAMQRYGFRIIPVHPTATEILGEKVYRRLDDITQYIDLIDIFRKSAFAGEAVDEGIALNVPAIWLQEGVIDEAAAARAQAAGITVIMDRCIYRDYRDFCV